MKIKLFDRKCSLSGGLVIGLLLGMQTTFAGQPQLSNKQIRIVVQDEAGAPVAGATVELKLKDSVRKVLDTDEKGAAVADNLPPGDYEVIVSKDGFETPAQKKVSLTGENSVEINFALTPKILTDKVDINANNSAAALPEQTSSTGTEIQVAQAKFLPNLPKTATDLLPLVPGIIRSPDGGIRISGSAENRSAFIVNSADVTDPATGQFGMTVPVDSVQTVNVFKTPYLAQYGRFTAGVVSVETKRGGDKWNFELNDPLPEFRIFGGNLRGLRDATPRVVFNGPLIKNRFYISQGTEYAIRKRPVQTLEFPNKETKSESVNSFTQLDYLFSGAHTLTGTFHLAPRKDSFVGLDFFNRRPVTPNWKGKDYTGTLIDRLTLGQNLLESALTVKNFTVNVFGQGVADMNLTPTGNTGNYFSWQDREARRGEWMETLSLKPVQGGRILGGEHNFKFGSIVTRTSNRGEFRARPVNILDNQGTLLRRIEFMDGAPFDLFDLETYFFAQDHWVITPKLAFDYGLRFERQGITETFRLAPRAGLAWTPFDDQKTVFRSGYGIFYDRVPLSVYAFDKYPDQVMTTFAPDGSVVDGPRRFFNITDRAEFRKNAFISSGGSNAGNFAPYSGTWNLEVERALAPWLRLRGGYLSSNSSGLIVINPKVVQGQDAMVLGGGGKSRYRQFELVGKMMFQEGRQQLFFSYVKSRSRSDVNEFNTYIGNFPFPVVRINQFARGSADLPHRFLGWGTFNLPWKMRYAPILEYRNGLPFSTIDSSQAFVGEVNSARFPNFFSFDSRISKDFQVSPKYALRFSVTGNNLTNHFNALDVRRNTADPQVGVFFGNNQRRFRVDFDVLF